MDLKADSLESLCELIIDCPHSTPKWTDYGKIVLRNQNIRNGVLDLSNSSFTNEVDYQKRIKRAIPQAGDIVFTREAPMGEVCIIPEGLTCCLGQRQVLLRPRKDVSGEYIFWALQSPYVQHQISWNEGTGTTVSNVRIPVLKALMIPRNPHSEVNSAQILTNLAKKIELNTQTNQTLEQMAQTLFKSWFVDFDPVFDNALLKAGIPTQEPHSNEDDQQLFASFPEALRPKAKLRLNVLRSRITTQERGNEGGIPTQALGNKAFPSEFEFNDQLGWIPKGWEVKTINDFGKVITGKTPPKKVEDAYEKNGVSFITPTDISDENFVIESNRSLSQTGQLSVANNRIEPWSICVTCIGSQMGKTVITPKEAFTNQQINSVVVKDEYLHSYLFLNLRGRREEIFLLGSSGSTMPILNKTGFQELKVLYAGEKIHKAFNDVSKLNLEGILQRTTQNIKLTKLRDTLLPKLISGELKIPVAEQLVKEMA